VRWLVDEMLPTATADQLRDLGHDAIAVREVDLAGAEDERVMAFAVAERRIVVTENFADFARLVELRHANEQSCVPVVFVRKCDLPKRGALATHLARRLDRWAARTPDPYPGLHWP
jgi:predicted nuclease of predicted toxin-antitoxin system